MAKGSFRLIPYRLLPWVDWLLIALTIVLIGCGILTLWGATSGGEGPGPLRGFALRQLIFAGVGFAMIPFLIWFDYRRLRSATWFFYWILVLLLIGLLVKGQAIKGARSWYDLGFFNFQPIEPGKIVLVLALARYLSARVGKFKGVLHTIPPLLIVGLPLGLVFIQPDLGSTAVLLPVIAAMFWVAGLRKWVFAFYLMLGVGAALYTYPHLKPYQQERIKTFLNPEADKRGQGWNITQAKITLGSGGLVGKGWGRGTQTAMNFLPEFHTDFIFPTVGEQFGLVGCAIVLALLGLLVARMVLIAARTHDLFGVLVVTGLAATLATHVFFNVGMCVGVLPVTGLPLPFFSYGGSFLLTCMLMIGLTLSVAVRRGLSN